jgi:hypothetical protein
MMYQYVCCMHSSRQLQPVEPHYVPFELVFFCLSLPWPQTLRLKQRHYAGCT